ncbi:MFS transporter [Arthrobacter sp. YC-RL1]|uniref:MFS transporter n=1 Tax=Arthrobacter sp. YC-RL1 TaxID=1652545 RepID=UPI00063DBBBD|nr:MFS transporter [Arthrobacter sp. YC-RL1]KLI90446.1 MFS transporter [Arthrobacter sp. YC-RL1]
METHPFGELQAAELNPPKRSQRRVIAVLIAGQILGGIGMGASVSLGAILAVQVAGSAAWSGMAATMNTLGAAAFAIPLARAAIKRGRHVSLAMGSLAAGLGAAIAITATALAVFPLLLTGLILLGAGTAVNFQARFAATDLSTPNTRGRDLSIVVWATTIGAVSGPNLFEPGEMFGRFLHLPTMTGAFAFTVIAQLLAAAVFFTGLRYKPSAAVAGPPVGGGNPPSGWKILGKNPNARFAVAAVALSHGTMVALMSMTPVHLHDHGASLAVVGFTISLHIAGMFGLSPFFGWLADRLGRISVLLFGQAMLLVSLIFAWLSPDSLVTPSLILLGLGWSASIVSGSAMVAESVMPAERTGLQGVSDLVMNLMAAACGALAGPVLAALGYSGLGLATMALVLSITIWTVFRLKSLLG